MNTDLILGLGVVILFVGGQFMHELGHSLYHKHRTGHWARIRVMPLLGGHIDFDPLQFNAQETRRLGASGIFAGLAYACVLFLLSWIPILQGDVLAFATLWTSASIVTLTNLANLIPIRTRRGLSDGYRVWFPAKADELDDAEALAP